MKFHFVWILFVLVTVFIIYLWTMAEQRRDLFFLYNLADNPESSARSEIQVRETEEKFAETLRKKGLKLQAEFKGRPISRV